MTIEQALDERAVRLGRRVYNKLKESNLTSNELEVAILLCKGFSPDEIAVQIRRSESAVHGRCGRIYRKLNVHSQYEMMAKLGHEALNEELI